MRIDLDVPFSEKDAAKSDGAKWDGQQRTWYAADAYDARKLAKWTKASDRIPIVCEADHIPVALMRGALTTDDGTLYIPCWLGLDRDLAGRETVARLCYWLPKTHPEYKDFGNAAEAAMHLAVNGGYVPVDQYLPAERKAMDALLGGRSWYIHSSFDRAYYRHVAWDSY